MKRLFIWGLAVALLAAPVGGAAIAKKKAGPTVVGTDPADDWGSNVDATLAPVGGPLGQDLLEASIDGDQVELDGKWSNYSRGACDPTGNSCPPPRDPGMQPFLIRGDCASNGAAVACKELGLVQATFDAASGTITIPVPLELIGAKPGSKIAGATQADSGFSGVSAAPSAFYSLSTLPYDTLLVDKTFTVPKK